jgi:hypothetical protein
LQQDTIFLVAWMATRLQQRQRRSPLLPKRRMRLALPAAAASSVRLAWCCSTS